MWDWLFRRRKADHAPAVKEAIEKRDALFAEAEVVTEQAKAAMHQIDRDYEEAEKQRKARRRR